MQLITGSVNLAIWRDITPLDQTHLEHFLFFLSSFFFFFKVFLLQGGFNVTFSECSHDTHADL